MNPTLCLVLPTVHCMATMPQIYNIAPWIIPFLNSHRGFNFTVFLHCIAIPLKEKDIHTHRHTHALTSHISHLTHTQGYCMVDSHGMGRQFHLRELWRPTLSEAEPRKLSAYRWLGAWIRCLPTVYGMYVGIKGRTCQRGTSGTDDVFKLGAGDGGGKKRGGGT